MIKRKLTFFQENIFIVTTLSAFLIIFFYDVVFLGKTFKATTANAQAMSYGVYGQKENRPVYIPVNGTDASVLEEPIYEFIKQNLHRGILPLWNPHQACGYPLIGMIQVGMFFPLNIIFYILPQPWAWDIFILSRLFFGGLLMYWLMRTLRFKKVPALGSALVFMLTGPMVLLQYWIVNVEIIAPLLLLCLERLIREPKVQNVCFVGMAVALTFFGGHPEHIFFVNVLGFLFFCFRLFFLKKRANVRSAVIGLGGGYILGVGLSAMVLFPFLRNFVSEFWHNHPTGVGLTTGEVVNRIITLAIPHFFQKESLTYDFTFAGWWGGYLGTIPLALAFLSLFSRQRQGLNYFFAVFAFILIGKSYSFPIINWIGYLPLFDVARFYIHTPHLVALSVAILAGMGIRTVAAGTGVFKKGMIFSVGLALASGFCLIFFWQENHRQQSISASLFTLGVLVMFQLVLLIRDNSSTLFVIASAEGAKQSLWKGLLRPMHHMVPGPRNDINGRVLKKRCDAKYISVIVLVILGLELFCYIHRERPRRFDSFPKIPYIDFLKNLPHKERAYGIFWNFYPNTATGYGVDDFGVFQDFLPKRYVQFVNNLLLRNYIKSDLKPPAIRAVPLPDSNPFLNLLNIGYIIGPANPRKLLDGVDSSPEIHIRRSGGLKDVHMNVELSETTKLFFSREVSIYQRGRVFPRAFVAHRARFEPRGKIPVEALKAIHKNLREVVVIEHEPVPEIEQQLAGTQINDNSKVQILRYNPNAVEVDAYLEEPGFLVLSDAYHPDWQAFIDGEPTTVYPTDYLIRSVFLSPGQHQIRFVFRPASFYWGLWISGLSWLLVIIFLSVYKFTETTKRRIREDFQYSI